MEKKIPQKARTFDLKIQNSVPFLTLMQVLPAKRQKKSCTEIYLERLKNQNVKHLVNLFESNSRET